MKITLESIVERLMVSTHLRAIVWLSCILFCIVFWGLCIHYGLKVLELLLTLFKVA